MEKQEQGCIRTKLSLLLMSLTSEPLAAFYTILPFILRRELNVSAFQLSLFVMLRPVLSSFSFFWGASLGYKKSQNLLRNHIFAWIIARLPFLFFPLIHNFYYIFFAAGVYQFFYRAGLPAWNEIIKRKIPNDSSRKNLFSLYSVFGFIESILIGIFIGNFLDKSAFNWKLVFFFSALLGLSSLFIQMQIKVPINTLNQENNKNNFFTPISDIFKLLKRRKDFATFQRGFMAGGFALMFISPALIIFSSDILNITYNNMMIGRFVFMGIGFVISMFFWKKALDKTPIEHITILVLLGFSIYMFFLLMSKFIMPFFYLSFFFYGVAQAGSTLLWSLSAMIFAKEENSLLYTSTNLLLLGIRGLIAPLLGSLFCDLFGVHFALLIGILIAVYGVIITLKSRRALLSYD